MRDTFLVYCDICDDRRLATVHKTMRGFGDHLQHSIFECQLKHVERVAFTRAARYGPDGPTDVIPSPLSLHRVAVLARRSCA